LPQPKPPLSWPRLCLSLAATKDAAAAVVIVWGLAHRQFIPAGSFPPEICLAFLAIYGGWGIFLLLGGRDDPRARDLAGFHLTVAAAYAKPLRYLAPNLGPPWANPLLVLEAAAVDAFIPYFLWRFARDFPEPAPNGRERRWLGMAVRASGWMGVALLCGMALFAGTGYRQPPWLRIDAVWCYDTPLCLAIVGAFLALLARMRLARGDERARARLFLGAFVLGAAPLVVQYALYQFVPAFDRYMTAHPPIQRAGLYVGLGSVWLIPGATAYATLVDGVFTLRWFARRSLHYAAARWATLAVASLPFAVLLAYLVENREMSVADLLSGTRLILLAGAVLLGVASLRYRERVLDAIDRRYFREQYDARQILTQLVRRIRGTHGVDKTAELVCREVDRALHLEAIALLVEDRRSGQLAAPLSRAKRLDTSSPLVQLVAGASDPIDVDLGNPRSPFARLPASDRQWLAEHRVRLLVPIVARDGNLLGLLALGEKKSGLPFLSDDRKLLYDIASSAALGLELELEQSSTGMHDDGSRGYTLLLEATAAAAERAKECLACGTLFQPYTVFCGSCSRRLETALVPYVLPGRFRFERRLGVGGMGVVYRGIDLPLGRPVAVKTLRRISPEDAMRLRREARTAAGVSHPHLAAVHNMETWQGMPMLIMELMEGGTLAQRIERGPLDQRETVELGIAMASALDYLHSSDILHRDIKPSNIGFTRAGTPKLMDFGIARLMLDLRRDRGGDDDGVESAPIGRAGATWEMETSTSETVSRQLVGTLSYLSPEALDREAANVSFDLWAIAMVLYECVLGRKIFSSADVKNTMSRIRTGRIPDFEQACPWGDPALGEFFRSALHRTIARRPQTAREMRQRLEKVLARMK
jgi:hypothetical protein